VFSQQIVTSAMAIRVPFFVLVGQKSENSFVHYGSANCIKLVVITLIQRSRQVDTFYFFPSFFNYYWTCFARGD